MARGHGRSRGRGRGRERGRGCGKNWAGASNTEVLQDERQVLQELEDQLKVGCVIISFTYLHH